MKLPYLWLTDLVNVPGDPESIAAALALRGFEVASVEHGRQPVIDFEITANRPDCLSIIGLAREASAAFGVPLQRPEASMPPAGQPQPIDVTIEDPDLCPRYCAQVFEVRSNGLRESPSWMRDRLEACGVRSINAIVDVTNYVLLETGQPTHAFDYSSLAGRALRVRRAAAGEKLTTLDGVERALDPDMLVIADGERPQAVAGVMGGAHSEIGPGTKLLVLESAYFKPASVRRTSKKLGLKTEASTRFERGADIDAAPAAIARIAALLQQIGAAQPVGPTIDRYPSPRAPLVLSLRSSRIERVLGTAVADAEVPARLEPLGFSLSDDPPIAHRPSPIDDRPPAIGHRWLVTVPTFRVDVLREVDLIEEIARHDGYQGLPATFPKLDVAQAPPDPRTLRDRRLRHVLTACGFSEAQTFSFIEVEAAEAFASAAADGADRDENGAADHTNSTDRHRNEAADHTNSTDRHRNGAADHADSADRHQSGAAARAEDALIRVANPLSEKFAVLRPSLLAGLVDAAAHNRRRQHADVRLFETGTRFTARGEVRSVAGVWAGAALPAHWSGGARPADFYDIKGVVEAIGSAFAVTIDCAPAEVPYLVAGKSASVTGGVLGQIRPEIAAARGFPAHEPLWAFEIDAAALGSAAAVDEIRATSLPRFPSIVRDLSILVDSSLPAAAVRGTIRSSAPAALVEVSEFDRYTGSGVPADRVSLSLRLTFRSTERTLTDAEADAAMDGIVTALAAAHNAVRR